MRVLSWNILQGGGRRIDGIAEYVLSVDADIIALQEFRAGRHGDTLSRALTQKGFAHQYVAEPEKDGGNTLLIAAKESFDAGDFVPDRQGPCHMVEASFPHLPLVLLNIHFPQKEAQRPLFDMLETDTPSLLKERVLMVGDMNCGIPFEDSDSKTFQNTARFQNLLGLGWVDCFRSRHQDAKEFSWVSPRTGNRFRYDHAFASAGMDKNVTSIRYDHDVRAAKLSDHSALIIDLDGP